MNTIPTNTDEMIDSRDVIEALADHLDPEVDSPERIAAFRKLADDGAANVPDWIWGETLIRDSYFTEYAKELAADIGAMNEPEVWPHNHIDWAAAADALRADYIDLDFDGVTYWARA